MLTATGLLDWEGVDEFSPDLEPGYIASTVRFHIPVSCDLDSVSLMKDRVEDGLLGQAGRKSSVAGFLDQPKFSRADWSPEGDSCHIGHRPRVANSMTASHPLQTPET